jgi:Uma2 family endonuclease
MAVMVDYNTLAGRIRPLKRAEYDRMVELGVFEEDEKIELIKGFIVRMSPTGVPHASTVQALNRLFVLALAPSDRASVRVQSPFAASDESEPEPDIAVLPPGEYRDDHPKKAFLVIEVSESTLRYDRGEKADVYAEAGIEEYWIVNTRDRLIEVRTDIVDGVYTQVTTYRRGQTISPRAFPDLVIPLEKILG